MILLLTTTQFTDTDELYYSSPFRQTDDSLMTISVELRLPGTVSVQQSIDEISWFDVENSSFTCNTIGLQTFIECDNNLSFRLKTTQEVITAKIAL